MNDPDRRASANSAAIIDVADIADAALFPAENPHPVLRVSAAGRVLYANRASRPLLAAWQVGEHGCIPPVWQERLAGLLAAGEARAWDEPCGERTWQLDCAPIPGAGYVNIYASDVTQRVALLAQLTAERQRLAEAACSAEQRAAELQTILDTIADGVVLYDQQGRVMRINAAAVDIMGYTSADVSLPLPQRAALIKVTMTDDPAASIEQLPLSRAIRGEIVRGQLARFARDGDEPGARYILVSAAPVLGVGGVQTGVVGSFSDVTELRRARDELAQRVAEREGLLAELAERNFYLEAQAAEINALNAGLERRVVERTAELEAIFASIPDALYVADAGGIVRANQAALDAFGVASLQELREGPSTLPQRIHAHFVDTGEPVLFTDAPVVHALRGEGIVREIAGRRPGSGAEVTYRNAGAPIVVDGRIVGAVGLATDITEQKRAQQQLAFQANLLARISDAVIATDLDQRITSWNHAAETMFGWSAAEALGRPFAEVLPTEIVPPSATTITQELAAAGHWRGELIMIDRAGSQVHVETNAVLVRDVRGQVVGQVGVSRDITRRKRAEAQNARLLAELTASEEQLRGLSRRLVALQEAERTYVADQLFNQAGQVLAALQLQLAQWTRTNDQRAGRAPEIEATLNRAIHELHDLASQLRPAGLDYSTLAGVLRSEVLAFGQAHGLAVHFCAGNAEGLRVPKDAQTAIYRVVQEGLTNIARHAGASAVELELACPGDVLTVRLADNGLGFDTQSIAAGGLGLASIRQRLEVIGGRLQLTSGPAGTTLFIEAPLSNAPLHNARRTA